MLYRPQPVMLKILPIMLLNSAQNIFTHYAQYIMLININDAIVNLPVLIDTS